MRIAISTDGELVSPHFGRCPTFTIIDIDGGKVVKRETFDNPGHRPGFIPQFLYEKGVKCIVCGGMGRRASGFFSEYGIQTILGITGRIEEVLEQIEKGVLEGGESLCKPGSGKGYGLDRNECDHQEGHGSEH